MINVYSTGENWSRYRRFIKPIIRHMVRQFLSRKLEPPKPEAEAPGICSTILVGSKEMMMPNGQIAVAGTVITIWWN